ncbi:MAG: heavy-metal-associated domain-containing protein [Nitrospinae bacterium]|nr:heavy-metal-associated domain-containing protein [Nitrospinota bacterium]
MVKTALERLDGVKQVTVTFDPPEAVVEYDPERVTPEKMIASIEQVGFRAKANP